MTKHLNDDDFKDIVINQELAMSVNGTRKVTLNFQYDIAEGEEKWVVKHKHLGSPETIVGTYYDRLTAIMNYNDRL